MKPQNEGMRIVQARLGEAIARLQSEQGCMTDAAVTRRMASIALRLR